MRKLDEKEYEIVWKKIDEKFDFEPAESLRNHIFNIDKEYKVYEIDDRNCGDETYQSRINKILKKVVNDDMYALDWQHESFIYNPNENITLEQSGWLGNSGIYDGFPCYYPNGDYFFFVSLDFTKALLGVPGFGKEKSLLFVVGKQLIEEIDKNKVELLMTEYEAKTYICPICGYDKLTMFPSNSYEICCCCGYEFGSMEFNGEDVGYSYDYVEDEKFFSYIRKLWLDSGCKWWREEEKPNNWDVEDQLKNIKSEKRLFEEKVIELFVSQIPMIKEFTKDSFKYYEIDESAGMYIVLPDIIRYLTDCINKKDFDSANKFFEVYNKFYENFNEEYHEINPSDTMYNLNAVELFEIIDEYEKDDKDKVLSMMSEKLRKEYLEIYNKN